MRLDATASGGVEGALMTKKYLLLGAMIIQGAVTVVISRYTRSIVPIEHRFSVNHLILTTEIAKLMLNLALEFVFTANLDAEEACSIFTRHNYLEFGDAITLVAPASLYFVQNTCTYTALAHLTAPLFQVLFQTKLLTTAAVSVCVFGRKYSMQQWTSLFFLSVGVAAAVLSEATNEQDGKEVVYEKNSSGRQQNPLIGLGAVAMATICSALAGVYFEKIVKRSVANGAQKPSLYMRNIQLAFFSSVIAVVEQIMAYRSNSNEAIPSTSQERNYFAGFTTLVWILVALQSTQGLIISAVMKYSDNVVKGVASGSMVLLSTILSAIALQTDVTSYFAFGALLVIGSSYVFANPESTMNLVAVKECICTLSHPTRSPAMIIVLVSTCFVAMIPILYYHKVFSLDPREQHCPKVFSSGVKCHPNEPGASDHTKPSCALVLNAGALLKHEDGHLVDTYDEVIRINGAPVTGYEKFVGSRTTYIAFNGAFDKLLDWARQHEQYSEEIKLIAYPRDRIFNDQLEKMESAWHKYLFDVDYMRLKGARKPMSKCIEVVANITSQKSKKCSSGMMLTLWTMEQCRAVTIFGANQDSCYPHHYFDMRTTLNHTSKTSNCTNRFYKYFRSKHHSFETERMAQMIYHTKGQLFINRFDEVAWPCSSIPRELEGQCLT